MIKTISESIPKNSISYMLIFGGIIVLIVLLIIIPFHRYNVNRAKEVQQLEASINEQQGLRQIYQLLKNVSGKRAPYTLPNPAKAKLSRQDVDQFQETFRQEAGRSGLMTVSLMPDVKTAGEGSQNLLYNTTLKGEFANFRKLLVRLGALPYVNQIEEIDIRQHSDLMEFKMRIWIALANQPELRRP